MAEEGFNKMTDDTIVPPKAQFKNVGALYQAVIDAGMSVGKLNRETADTLMRELVRGTKRAWGEQNPSVVKLWNSGGDDWHQLIKDVKAYASVVNQHRRDVKKAQKNKT